MVLRMARHLGRNALLMLGLSSVLAVVGYGCRDATQVTLVLSTDVLCSDLKGIDIVVAADPSATEERAKLRFSSTSTNACVDGRIGTLVLTPGGETGAVLVIAGLKERASTCVPPLYAGCIVARRHFSFLEYTGTTLPVLLQASCVDVPCNAKSTCAGVRQCVDSRVDCSGSACGEPGRAADGGLVVVDGAADDGAISTLDGGRDAAVDASDAAVDGGTDASSGDAGYTPAPFGFCPPVAGCPFVATLKASCSATPAPVACCNDATSVTTARCETVSGCNGGFAACCSGQQDCPGLVCCASTAMPVTGTRVACVSGQQCAQTTQTYICTVPAKAGQCPSGKVCTSMPFGPAGYYRCN